MSQKLIVFIVGVSVVSAVFGGFILLASALLIAADNVETEPAGKVVIAVRHKMYYEKGKTLSKTQCVQPEIGICETLPALDREDHRVGASNCSIKSAAPQPFFSEPNISAVAEYEFELEPDKTYFWYVYLDNYEECSWLTAEYAGFETGEIKLETRETKRIEVNFTEDTANKSDAQQSN